MRFSYTFRLGFLAVFLFALEVVTGLFLMVYYAPTPETAYPSILRITAEVSFGYFIRNLHRLAGEVMVVVVVLHLLRTFITDSFRDCRAFTWVTGVMLLLLTLGLAFSGYLLPWDQLAYWAVTIGTSMAEVVPIIGRPLNLLLRGTPDIGADGLLRFYLMHVIVLPSALLITLGWHYYRVTRRHGISLPLKVRQNDYFQNGSKGTQPKIPYLPEIFFQELFLGTWVLLVLSAAALFFYEAPLSLHADPRQTPLDTQAPWFFLWLQGLLKLGPKTIMGVLIPLLMLAGLFVLPYLDRSPRRPLKQRPRAIAGMILSAAVFPALTIIGTHHIGMNLPPAARLLQAFAPAEGTGEIHSVSFEALPVGIYPMTGEGSGTPVSKLSPEFAGMLKSFHAQVAALERSDRLPAADAVVLAEDWQVDLKRITFRITWTSKGDYKRKTAEAIVHRHRHRRFLE